MALDKQTAAPEREERCQQGHGQCQKSPGAAASPSRGQRGSRWDAITARPCPAPGSSPAGSRPCRPSSAGMPGGNPRAAQGAPCLQPIPATSRAPGRSCSSQQLQARGKGRRAKRRNPRGCKERHWREKGEAEAAARPSRAGAEGTGVGRSPARIPPGDSGSCPACQPAQHLAPRSASHILLESHTQNVSSVYCSQRGSDRGCLRSSDAISGLFC